MSFFTNQWVGFKNEHRKLSILGQVFKFNSRYDVATIGSELGPLC